MSATDLDPRLTPARRDLADERLRGRVEAARFVAGVSKCVAAPVAPLRRRPVPDAPLDTEALMGEGVTVFDEDEGWAWAQLESDGYVGYLPSEALAPPGQAPDHRVSVLRTFVYPGPDLKLPPFVHLSLGSLVAVAGREGDYARLASGGFVFAAHLAPVAEPEPDFVAVAEHLVGTPYLWGGRTSLGLDCSGLIQLALAVAGIAAPRDSDMQAALGEPVEIRPDLAGLVRGDLVCWRGHIGVMADSSRLIHANGHHMLVAIEPLAEAMARIRHKSFGPITAIRRLPAVGSGSRLQY